MKILVVHRQKEVVDKIKLVLQQCEPFIRYSDSGLDGLLAARVENFDLIICGTDLPVITGFELVRSVRTASINRNATVIFLADEIDAKAEHLGNALGVTGMLATRDLQERLGSMVIEPGLSTFQAINNPSNLN
jgi:DNA-binding response OmpR family regulator